MLRQECVICVGCGSGLSASLSRQALKSSGRPALQAITSQHHHYLGQATNTGQETVAVLFDSLPFALPGVIVRALICAL